MYLMHFLGRHKVQKVTFFFSFGHESLFLALKEQNYSVNKYSSYSKVQLIMLD